jgi:hypothetical protein
MLGVIDPSGNPLDLTVGGGGGSTYTPPTYTPGSVLFAGADGLPTQDNAKLFWDDTNNRLGVGRHSAGAELEVEGTSYTSKMQYVGEELIIGNNKPNALYLRNLNGINFINSYNWPITGAVPLGISASYISYHTGVNDAETARLTREGNFGLGTSAPANFGGAGMHILNGNVAHLLVESGSQVGEFIASPGNIAVGSRSNHDFYIVANDARRIHVTPSGSVGVGESLPNHDSLLFVVNHNIAKPWAQAWSLPSDGAAGLRLSADKARVEFGSLQAGKELGFLQDGVMRAKVTSTGIAIGSGDYVVPLSVVNYNAIGGHNYIAKFSDGINQTMHITARPDAGVLMCEKSFAMYTGGSEKFRFSAAGRLGIGNNAPIAPLHVEGLSYLNGNIEVNGIANIGMPNVSRILLRELNGQNRVDSLTDGHAAAYPLAILGNGTHIKMPSGGVETELAVFDNDMCFKLGTTQKLAGGKMSLFASTGFNGFVSQVQGSGNNSFLALDAASNLVFYVDYTGMVHSTSGGIAGVSDERLKKNIAPLHYGLKEILELSPVSYDLIDAPLEHKRLGFLAGAVKKIMPELVGERMSADKDGVKYLTLNVTEMIPALVNAIHSLNAEIQALKGAN